MISYITNHLNPQFNLSGFSPFEENGIWISGHTGVIEVSKELVEDNKISNLELDLFFFFGNDSNLQFEIFTSWGGSYHISISIDDTHAAYLKNIPVEKFDNYLIVIKISNPRKPAGDERKLGVGVRKITLSNDNYHQENYSSNDLGWLGSSYDFKNKKNDLRMLRRKILNSQEIVADSLASFIRFNGKIIDRENLLSVLKAAFILRGYSTQVITNFLKCASLILQGEISFSRQDFHSEKP